MLANLLLRTEYSFMKSLCALKDVVKKSKELGYNAIAITDFGNLHGGYKFYKECIKNKIKPIIGIQIELMCGEVSVPIVLYAMDNFGYQNVLKLASKYKITGYPIELEYLSKCNIGVIGVMLAGCSIIENRNTQFINRIKVEFSNFYIGITKEILNDSYLELHTYLKGLGLEEVGLLDTRYLDDSDIESYEN